MDEFVAAQGRRRAVVRLGAISMGAPFDRLADQLGQRSWRHQDAPVRDLLDDLGGQLSSQPTDGLLLETAHPGEECRVVKPASVLHEVERRPQPMLPEQRFAARLIKVLDIDAGSGDALRPEVSCHQLLERLVLRVRAEP